MGWIISRGRDGHRRAAARCSVSSRPELVLPLGQAAQAVLDDDDRAVDDQPEVDRAEAHQVAADPALHHAGRGQQHRERDHERRDQRRAEVAEQQEQHDDDEERALGEVRRDGRDRGVDQLGAVRAPSWPRRPAAACGAISCILASTAAATVRLFSPISISAVPTTTSCPFSLALPVRSSRPTPTSATSRTRIGTPSRVATTTSPISSMRLDAAVDAHDVALAVVLDVAGAAADVVRLERLDDVARTSGRADELRRVGLDVVLLHVAADRIDAGDALHALELRADDPVLHRAQIGGALELVREALPFGREVAAVALPARLAVARCACARAGGRYSTVHM